MASGPSYIVHPPAPPLAGLIECFWALTDAPSHSRERVVPSGTIEMVFNLHEDEFRIQRPADGAEEWARFHGSIVSGAYGQAFGVETRAHASIIGVHFRPGGAAPVLGIPAGELADAHVALDALWGRRAVDLRERLADAAGPSERFRILEQALIDGLVPLSDMRAEVAFALGRLGAPGVEVRDVARHVHLSHRRFIALFTERVGMTPKRYSRVRRFQRALGRTDGSGTPAWSRIALDCGYFDQAHLCRDWAEFTGVSPAEFLRLRRVPVKENHVALPEPSTTGSPI
jgi:AraC-like DNA-binding protein